MNRSKNSIRNILFGVGVQILNILMSFAYRTVFMHTLSDEYLGINGVFTNILMVFSLADLGVGTAIIFALYKPIAENDVKTAAQIGFKILPFTLLPRAIIIAGSTEFEVNSSVLFKMAKRLLRISG